MHGLLWCEHGKQHAHLVALYGFRSESEILPNLLVETTMESIVEVSVY